jgi:NAD(P)-dependent dehydrogenase (short-subunit alcohol dehydrogenase family)
MTKNVIVTGANGDIGFAITKILLLKGYSVIAFFHSQRRYSDLITLKKNNKDKIEIIKSDFSSSDNIKKCFDYINLRYSSIFGLINNAGIYPIVSFEDYTLDLWNKVLMINLTSPFLIIKNVLPLMKKKGGIIINISSTGAYLGSRDVGYSASKAGLIGFTKSLARNLAKYNIKVNAIAPGTIDTKMSRLMKKEDREKNKQNTLLKRLGKPEDIIGAVNFLLSEDSNYITGTTIDINGGLYMR